MGTMMTTELAVMEYHVSGWPVSEIDRKLGLLPGTARSIVVSMWRRDKEEWERKKVIRETRRLHYKNGGGM